MISGDKDSVVLHEDHAIPALNMIPEGILVTLKNASHTGFAQPASTFLRFLKNPDSIACRIFRQGQSDEGWKSVGFMSLFGGTEMGITDAGHNKVLSSPLIPVSMKAARQHMFTTLASHAFLESVFASDFSTRDASRRYLLQTLQAENADEVSVSRRSRSGADDDAPRRPRRTRRAKGANP
jgi:hypothetical protein